MNLSEVREILNGVVKAIDVSSPTVPPVVLPPDPVPLPVNTIPVAMGSNLADVVRAAPEGSALLLPSGFSWQGSLTVTKPLSFLGPDLASSVGRVLPAMLDGAPLIQGPILCAVPGVAFRRIRQIGVSSDDILMTLSDRCVLDQMVSLGSPLGAHRGVDANAADCRVLRSHVGNIWKDIDTQAISCFDGTKNLFVDDCFLESSGENVLLGGQDPKTEAGIPQDIVIQNSYLFKPLSWVGKPACTVKNLFEVKNAKRVKLLNCTLENSWVSGQVGFGVVLTVRNQDGSAPFSTIEDVLVEGNTVRHAQSGINILASDDTPLKPSQTMKRVTIRNNHFEQLGWQNSGSTIMLARGAEDLVFDSNTFDGNVNHLMDFGDPTPFVRFVVRGNRFLEGLYGIHSSAGGNFALGKPTLDAYAPGYVWENNTVVKGTSGRNIVYPPGTTMVTTSIQPTV